MIDKVNRRLEKKRLLGRYLEICLTKGGKEFLQKINVFLDRGREQDQVIYVDASVRVQTGFKVKRLRQQLAKYRSAVDQAERSSGPIEFSPCGGESGKLTGIGIQMHSSSQVTSKIAP